MIRIEISAAAYAALAAGSRPDNLLDAQRSPSGGFYLWLAKPLLAQLMSVREPRESYSEAILRLSREAASADVSD